MLVMLSASGGMVMAAANDLIVTFLGLEILSIAVYVLAAMHLRRTQSQEAAIKYFVLGAFSSAFFLYGIALVYGATGTHPARRHRVVRAAGLGRRRRSASTCRPISCSTAGRHARDPAGRHRPADRRLRVQGRRRAVPLLDARRLPGVAVAGGGVHGLGREGRRLRRAAAGAPRRRSGATSTTGSPTSTPSRWPPCWSARSWPIVQTDVKRLLAYSLDQPRRVHPRRRAGRQRAGHQRGPLLPGGLHVHGGRLLRRRHRRQPHRRRRHHARRLPGPGQAPTGAGLRLHPVPARPARCAVHVRVRGQVRGAGRRRRRRQRTGWRWWRWSRR